MTLREETDDAKAKSIPHVVCMTSKEKVAAAEHYSPKVS